MEVATASLRDTILKQAIVEARQIEESRTSLLPDPALARLALAPYYPLDLTQQGLALSTDPLKILERCVSEHLLQEGAASFPWHQPIFWMAGAEREMALQKIARTQKPEFLNDQLIQAGKAMLSIGGDRLKADAMLSRWAELAAAATSGIDFARLLIDRVGDALARSAKADALRWIEAAEPMVQAFGGAFEAAVATAKRRYELFHRRQNDELALRNYYVREESDGAFRALREDQQFWALHYVGSGGAGKTMLLRHIAINLAKQHEVAVSRIDFDYLNPEYPVRNPGLLLIALAEEFRLQAGTGSERVFQRLEEACNDIHRTIEGAYRQGRVLRVPPTDPALLKAIELFGDCLKALADNRQPIVILDTCEELAKVNPGGEVPRNVADTFAILEQLHRFNARLRVIFSGRRSLPEKTYLRVHPILGFTGTEAREFLEGYNAVDGARLKRRLIPGIMKLSIASEAPAPRYNPYDLDTYAKWVSADPDITESALAKFDTHKYVEQRIVARVRPVVRKALPALTLLGRFHRDLARALIGPIDPNGVELSDLLAQEWVRADSAGMLDTWRMDDLLQRKLLAYYRNRDGAAYHAGRAALARILPDFIDGRKFADLTPQLFAACLDVLADSPVRAVDWWQRVELRIATEMQWSWAAELMRFLEADLLGSAETPKWLAATVLATSASVMHHTSVGDTAPVWRRVLGLADDHPQETSRRRLRFRALCGLGDQRALESAPADVSAQDAACALSLMEMLIEKREVDAQAPLPQASLSEFLARAPAVSEIAAFAAVLFARLAMRSGSTDVAAQGFETALRLCPQTPASPAQVWLGWNRPANLRNRILLELSRFSRDQFAQQMDRLAQTFFKEQLQDIDSDRLASAWLMARSERVAFGSDPMAADFASLYGGALGLIDETPRCAAHRAYPPFGLALLEARALSPELEEALSQLQKLSATNLARSADVTRAIDRAMTRIIRWFRLESEGFTVPATMRESTNVDDVALVAVTGALNLSPPTKPKFSYHATTNAQQIRRVELDDAEVEYLKDDGIARAQAAEASARARRDDLGQLHAILLIALSHARHGDRSAARREIERVHEPYQRLAGSVNGLPGWDEIANASGAHAGSKLLLQMGAKPRPWRPMVTRLLACHADAVDRDLASWVRGNDMVLLPDKRPYVSVDLRFVIGRDNSLAPWALRWISEHGPVVEWVKKVAGGIVSFVIGASALIAMGAAAFKYLYWPTIEFVGGGNLGTGWHFALFPLAVFVVGWLISQLPQAMRLLGSGVARLIQVDVDVLFPSRPNNLNAPLQTPATMTSAVSLLGYTIRRELVLSGSTAEKYQQLAVEVMGQAPSLQSLPFRLVRWLFVSGAFEIKATVDLESAGAPWEFLWGLHPALKENPFFVRRVTRDRRPSPVSPWRRPVKVLTWGEFRQRWRQDWGENFALRSVLPSEASSGPAGEVGVLHIVGMPVDSGSAGMLIAVTDSAAGEKLSVRPEEIRHRFSAVRLCILQSPTAELRVRVSSDRVDAAVAKRIGAEIFRSGVPIVIVIPALPEEAAATLLDGIQTVLLRTPRNAVPALERAITSFRNAMLEQADGRIEDVAEVMADICIYARDRVSLKSES